MKKGITLVVMSVVILVFFILLGVIVVDGTKAIQETEKIEFLSEIMNIQQEVLDYYKSNDELPIVDTDIVVNLSSIGTDELKEFEGENITDNEVILCEVDFSKIDISDIKYGNKEDENDIYVLSKTTKRVYYIEGVKADDMVYYTYSNIELNSAVIPRNVETYQTKIQDAVFEKNENDYTNEYITAKVFLPIDATNIVVTTTSLKSVSDVTYEGFDKVVYVNYSSTDKRGNYDITVNYTYNGSNKTAEYSVDNYDAISPMATALAGPAIDGVREIAVSAKDTLSGIKVIKCEIGTGYSNEYFEEFGTEMVDEKCTMKDSSSYTIYVEDNASNYILIELNT